MTINHDKAMGDEKFEQYLYAELQQSQKYLMDDGFTDQLLEKLPATKKKLTWKEQVILIVPSLIITLIVLIQMPIAELCVKSWVRIQFVSPMGWIMLSMGFLMTTFVGLMGWYMKERHLLCKFV